MRKSLLALGLLAGCTALTAPANALTTWTGTSQTVFDPDEGLPETYTVSFTFDDSAPLAVFNETTFQGPPVNYQRAYFANITSFSVVGPRYSVSFGSGATSVSTLATSRFRDGNAGMFVFAGSDSTSIGYSLGFTYFLPTAFATPTMPTTLDISSAFENGFNLTEYYYDGDPADEIITSRELLNFRFASGGLVPAATAVPEPASWAMMLAGFGAVGYGMRRKNVRTTVRYA